MVKPRDPTSSDPAPNLDGLVALTHHRWAIPIVAELWRATPTAGGAKFVTLLNRLGPSRESLSDTLADLIAQGWAGRNTGIGHPMRPEYILTPRGRRIGPACARVVRALEHADATDLGRRKWSLPIIAAITLGSTRFNQLKATLRGLTVRALALALKDLHDALLITRTITDSYPPAPLYGLDPRCKRVAAATRGLARDIGLVLPPEREAEDADTGAKRRRATA